MLRVREEGAASTRVEPRRGERASARLARAAWADMVEEDEHDGGSMVEEQGGSAEGEGAAMEVEAGVWVEDVDGEGAGGDTQEELEEGFARVRRIWSTRPGGARRGWAGWQVEVEWEERGEGGSSLPHAWLAMSDLTRDLREEARAMARREHGVGAQGQALRGRPGQSRR